MEYSLRHFQPTDARQDDSRQETDGRGQDLLGSTWLQFYGGIGKKLYPWSLPENSEKGGDTEKDMQLEKETNN